MSEVVKYILQKVTNQRVYNVLKTFNLYELISNDDISNELISLNVINVDDRATLLDYLDGLKIKEYGGDDDDNIEYNLDDPVLRQNFNVVNLEIRDDEYKELIDILDKLRFFQYPNNPFLNEVIELKDNQSKVYYGGIILNNIPITIVTDDQVRGLMEITYPNTTESILRDNDLPVLYEICYNIIVLGVNDTKNFLRTISDRKDIFFLSPTMKEAKYKSELDLRNIRWKPKVTSSQPCPNCHEKKVELVYAKQTRSADEPQTIKYKCIACKHAWITN